MCNSKQAKVNQEDKLDREINYTLLICGGNEMGSPKMLHYIMVYSSVFLFIIIIIMIIMFVAPLNMHEYNGFQNYFVSCVGKLATCF